MDIVTNEAERVSVKRHVQHIIELNSSKKERSRCAAWLSFLYPASVSIAGNVIKLMEAAEPASTLSRQEEALSISLDELPSPD